METEVVCRRISSFKFFNIILLTVFIFDFHVKNYDDDTKPKIASNPLILILKNWKKFTTKGLYGTYF